MTLRTQFDEALKAAMKAREPRRVSTVRMMLAALKERDIASRSDENRRGVSDDEILSMLAKMIKQREESAAIYETAGRPELATIEREEIAIIREFQPRQMSEPETRDAASTAVAELAATSMKDMGGVMAVLKQRYAGQMDFARANLTVKELLSRK